jgi:hypothetical protein
LHGQTKGASFFFAGGEASEIFYAIGGVEDYFYFAFVVGVRRFGFVGFGFGLGFGIRFVFGVVSSHT